MPKKVSLKMKTGWLLLSAGLLGLAGCSTIGSGVDSVGAGVVSVAESVEKIATDVNVEKVAEEQFTLSQEFAEPVTSLDSWAMRIEARAVCPQGYVYLNRNARKSGGFAYSDADCVGGASCAFNLEWRIKCEDVPDEPFSFFGKT